MPPAAPRAASSPAWTSSATAVATRRAWPSTTSSATRWVQARSSQELIGARVGGAAAGCAWCRRARARPARLPTPPPPSPPGAAQLAAGTAAGEAGQKCETLASKAEQDGCCATAITSGERRRGCRRPAHGAWADGCRRGQPPQPGAAVEPPASLPWHADPSARPLDSAPHAPSRRHRHRRVLLPARGPVQLRGRGRGGRAALVLRHQEGGEGGGQVLRAGGWLGCWGGRGSERVCCWC